MNFRQNGDKYLITIEVIALIVVLVFGAVHFVMPGNKANKKITESQQKTQNPTQDTDGTQQVQADGQQAAPAFTPSDSVKTKLSSMTTEEKVAQLFITRPEEITGVSQLTQAGNKTKAAIVEKDFLLLQLMDMRHSRHHHSLEMLTQRAAVQER